MERNINIVNNLENLNCWIRRSIELFNVTAYLDNIQDVYPFQISEYQNIDKDIRREIIQAHNNRNTRKLLDLLKVQTKFPHEDPIWFLLKNVKGCFEKNPKQVKRIADILYSMTAEETLARLESPPKLNTQIGPMFRTWLKKNFECIPISEFQSAKDGIYILDASEEDGKRVVNGALKQAVKKRPDLICKVNDQHVIGEAKWIGQPGGNQEKQVQEVLEFCRNQRGKVRRVGIIDGFPWATHNVNGNLINNKETVLVQESEYDILSVLLLKEYLEHFQKVKCPTK